MSTGLRLLLLLTMVACGIAASEVETRALAVIDRVCSNCHSHAANKLKGGLALDSRAAALVGGDSGPALVPGDVARSRMIIAIRYADDDLKMPPKGKRLPPEDVAALEAWVAAGAPWTAATGPTPLMGHAKRKPGAITDEDRRWWAFQPLAQVEPPAAGSGWAANGIDRFIAERRERAGLAPAPEAGRAQLIRRASFALTGLPPAPEEVTAFVADAAPDAWPRLVDHLLESPRYGEHWARHWLDLVRYADGDGFRIDDYRPEAWRYRDWVIAAFNADLPYDRFVEDQLAGDELFPGDPQALVATGYLRHWCYEYNNRDVAGQRTNILNDLTDTTADVFMGLGMQCARCHDHKFDPLLQKDYYRLQAFFAPLLPRDDLAVATADERAAQGKAQAAWEERSADLRARIAALEAPYRIKAEHGAVVKFPLDIQAMWNKPADQRSPLEAIYADLIGRQVLYEHQRLSKYIKGDDLPKLIALQQELTTLEKDKPKPLPLAFAASDVGPQAPPVTVPKKPALGEIAPGFPTILDPGPAAVTASASSTGRRSALARWLIRADNPLSARVMVNRVWQFQFGQGLAVNSSDFGRLGEPPSHPELLDWLARRFIAEGWSLKRLQREILLSATWRQSAVHPHPEAGQLKDPENRLLWRGATRRIEAEAIRDAMLGITGELDTSAGGAGVDSARNRRSIFDRVMRNVRDPLLEVFDAADGFASTAGRNVTTTPRQALLMMNGDWALGRARAFALRLAKDAPGDDPVPRIQRAFQLAYAREARADEVAVVGAWLAERRKSSGTEPAAQASLIADKLPFRDGRAAVLSPGTAQDRLMVSDRTALPGGDFTIEAFVLLRAPYETGEVRTIAARWDGAAQHAGWAFGVTGRKSRYKPMTLVLQLAGGSDKDAEPVFSGLTLQAGRPYFVAASARLGEAGEHGITFFAKDLSNDDEQLQSSALPHRTTKFADFTAPITMGGHWGQAHGLWDGLIADVRLSDRPLPGEQLLLTSEGVSEATVGWWRFGVRSGPFADSSPHHRDLVPIAAAAAVRDPGLEAWVDLCHVLLNANEMIYVD